VLKGNKPGRQPAVDGDHRPADQMPPCATGGDVTACNVLALSGERDLWLRRELAAERRGYARGWDDGHRAGYEQAEADREDAWCHVMRRYAPGYERERADRALRAAEAGCRRDAAEHERTFVARAYNTPAWQRTDVQRATVQAYPPPAGRAGAA
jgi:hypothetical protein